MADASALASIASVASGLESLAEVDARDLSGDVLYTLFAEIEDAARRLDGLRTGVVAAVEADGRWAADGSRSLAAWLRRATQASPGRAHAQSRLARALRDHLPITAEALRAGTITAEHAGLMATHTTTSPDRLAGLSHEQVGEAFLVQQATELDAGDFARLLKRWAVAADPEAADRDWKDDVDKENVVLAKSLHGYHLQGWLSDAGGAALDAALRARTGVPSADDTRTPAQRRAAALVGLARLALDSGAVAPGAAIRPHLTVHVPYETLERLAEAQAGDALTHVGNAGAQAGQRMAQAGGVVAHAGGGVAHAGGGVAHAGRRTDPAAASPAPITSAPAAASVPAGSRGPLAWRGHTVDGCAPLEPGLRPTTGPALPSMVIPGGLNPEPLTGAAPAELDDGTPLPHALLARLACDSELARVVFGPASEILDSGRARRLFTPGQRRAIIARDRSCQYPGCDAPPHEGEIHHSIWWYAQYGQTRAQDGVLLCWFHHDYVHANAISIERASMGDAAETPAEPQWQFRDRHVGVIRCAPGRQDSASAA